MNEQQKFEQQIDTLRQIQNVGNLIFITGVSVVCGTCLLITFLVMLK